MSAHLNNTPQTPSPRFDGRALRPGIRDRSSGFVSHPDGTTVAFHATSGYETYRGLGWYDVTAKL